MVRRIGTVRILRPIEGQPGRDKPPRQIDTAGKANRDNAPVTIGSPRRARYGAAADLICKGEGRHGSAPIWETVGASAKLIRFRRVNSPKPNPLAVYLESVAVNNGCLSGYVLGRCGSGHREQGGKG
jgi:hypothetical protein